MEGTAGVGAAPDRPRSLGMPGAAAARRALLAAPHVLPLAQHVAGLRAAQPALTFPDFDPLDGGTEAEILLLLEKPGPMTAPGRGGSGFVSRDNDDPTAEAVFRFTQEAGLHRRRTAIWNVVPGWNGTIRVPVGELREGLRALDDVLPLFGRLRAVVMAGRSAQRAAPMLGPRGLRLLASAHPSPQVRASRPETWRDIPRIWAQAN